MKKIATITFHSSYNFGSCLQAYALQEYIKALHKNNCIYKIINIRTDNQKNMYKNAFEKKDFKNKIKRVLFLKEKNNLKERKDKYENFLNNYLQVTKEYNTLEDLKREKFDYDYYIAGSDQLWNLQAIDFDWAYFLEFTNSKNKISYSASFGPKKLQFRQEEKERIKKDLLSFKYLSVRENGSYENIKELTEREPYINVDPTLLLNKNDWNKIIKDDRLIKEKYIFMYNLKDKKHIKLAKKIAKKLNLKIIVANPSIYNKIYHLNTFYNSGPCEFLNLIKNAEIVLSSSFHGTIFSIIFNKPFFSLYGENDLRISSLLKKMELEERNISDKDYKYKICNAYNIDFSKSKTLLEEERKKSKEYLIKALEIRE